MTKTQQGIHTMATMAASKLGADFTIVTLVPDDTGLHFESSTHPDLSRKLAGKHFDDVPVAAEQIKGCVRSRGMGTLRIRVRDHTPAGS